MPKEKLPPAKEWFNRNIDDWNVLSFTEYLRHVHKETYGFAYVSKGWNIERGMLKNCLEEYGNVATKELIDTSFKTHKSNERFPGLNFWFIYTYKRKDMMPRILGSMKKEIEIEKIKQKQTTLSVDDMLDLL